MSYINTSAHHKFILQCHSFIAETLENGEVITDEKAEQLKADLTRLKQLAESYRQTFSQLPKLSHEYNNLQRQIRVNMRKLKLVKNPNTRNK